MVSSADLKPQICHQNDNISIKMITSRLKTLVGYYLSQQINQNVCHNYFAGLTKRFHNLWYLAQIQNLKFVAIKVITSANKN